MRTSTSVALLPEGDVLGSYQHGARIGVLVAAKGADEELVKQLAMHIAASKPEFVKPEDVSAEVVEKEYRSAGHRDAVW